jgi:NAD(P)H-hydrate epimerase
MSAAPLRTLSREGVRDLDRRAIEEWGIPSFALMESAGRACADEALRMLAERRSMAPARVHVLVGPGNNGGDGLVIARTLRNRGCELSVTYIGKDPAALHLSADFQLNWRLWTELGERIEHIPDSGPLSNRWLGSIASADLVVDALFGTGLKRPLEDSWKGAIERLNRAHAANERPRVLAVDIPSGLDADTGVVLGAAVRADATVTFIAAKHGFLRGAGPSHVGRVVVAEIGVPREWIEAEFARSAPGT